MRYKVSVIIPVYNARNYLEKRRAKIGKESPIDFGGLANDMTSGIKDLGSGLKGLFGKKK